ncbi:PEPxxWA-CTERM sorting domain-containing protein [Janthinobacterium sp. BJB401]|nr:PEPxxWA-CTERM sorting domain-containing protein [Janthinobacterium sp. BJB401]
MASLPLLVFDVVRTGNDTLLPSSIGGGQPPRGSSIIAEPFVPTVILPSLPPTDLSVLPAVPEPHTWAMLLAGLALLAGATLRRRPAAAA